MRNIISLMANITGLLVLFFVASGSSYAAMYKWVDADGEVHYGQHSPVDVEDVKIIKGPPSVDIEKASKILDEQNKGLDKLREERIKKAEEEKKEEEKLALEKENCKKSQARLKSYTARPTVQLVQEDGSRVRATEEQRQEEIRKSQEMVKEWCK
ncbi:MAG: hypothetical protein ACI85N_001222 [Gammaproteobacteria bacterium]|jgi:hypothetical protein